MSSFEKNGTSQSEAKAPRKERKPISPTIRWLIIGLVCVVAVVAVALTTSGEDDPLADVAAIINYYANGGEFENHKTEKQIGYESGSFPLDIQYTTKITKGSVAINERSGYVFEGWYLPVTENGELVYNEDGSIALGEKFDFTVRLEDGAEIDLYAKWSRAEYVSVVLVGTDMTDSDGNTYKEGTEIYQMNFQSDGSVNEMGGESLLKKINVPKKAYTLVKYYTDEACTEAVSWPIKNENGSVTIYAKFLEGAWTVVSTANDAAEMLGSLNGETNYYLINDIDMTDMTAVTPAMTVKATVVGNGFTISNVTIKRSEVQNQDTSMFGELTASASITDLTLENVELNVSVKAGTINVYFLFEKADAEATVEGLTVKGTMTVGGTASVTILNIDANNGWILGGDDQSLLTGGGLTVEVTCSYNGEEYKYSLTQG